MFIVVDTLWLYDISMVLWLVGIYEAKIFLIISSIEMHDYFPNNHSLRELS